MGTIFWGDETLRGVTVGVIITVVLVGSTVGGTLVVTVGERGFVTLVGAWWGGLAVQDGQTHVTPGIHGP